jgi:hypothetical protein
MPLLVNSVPNLAQGVSQQPDNLRYPGQCDEQINAWATVVEGLVKRPPTEYTKKIGATDPGANLFTHFVKRDETNKYCVTVSLGGVGVINLEDGTNYPVTVTSIASSYLSLGTSITNPLADLRALTVADATFLVNTKKEVKVDDNDELKSKDLEFEALVVVKLGDYEKNYDIYLENQLVRSSGSNYPTGVQSDQFPSAGHTYESGDSQGSKGGEYADTAVIAQDLGIILGDYLSGQDGLGSVELGTSQGGSGFEDSGKKQRVVTGIVSALKPIKNVSYEFFLDQYSDATHTTKIATGTKGTAVFSGGSLASYRLTHKGINYDNTLALNTYKLIIRKHTSSTFGSMMGDDETITSYINIDNSVPGYVLPSIDSVTSESLNYQIFQNGSVIKIKADADFTIRTEDGLSNEALKVAYKEVDSIVDLPKHCYNQFRIKVRGDADIDQDDYYVVFKTKDNEDFGEGAWVETVGWRKGIESARECKGINTALDITTMPITLVADSYDPVTGKVDSFTLQTPNEYLNIVKHNSTYYNLVETHVSNNDNEPGTGVDWRRFWVETTAVNSAKPWNINIQYFDQATGYSQRQAGDDNTNPFPSFVGGTINDVFFFKNRLGFLTDSNVIFSEADEYFNFFRTTTQQLLDSAPIDVGLSHTKVAVLQHAVPFQEKLMLFSKQSQFVLRGADILSPKTVSISPVTEYDISDSVQPIALGNYIYFTFRRNDFEGMYEYFVDNNTETFNSEEITSQIPKYITKQVEKIAGSQAENTIVVGTSGDRNTLFVYKYFWSNKEKIQSAWMKFTFGREVRGFDFIDSNLHLFTKDDDGLHLEKLTLEDGIKDAGLDYTLYLDSKIDHTVGSLDNRLTTSYDAASKTTTISGFPYDPADVIVYTKTGNKVTFTKTTSTAGTVGGDLTSTDFVAGIPYNMLYRFSDQTLKQPTERGGRSASDYAFQTIRNGSLNYAETGHFTVEVTPKFRDKYTYAFNPDIVGANLTLNAFTPQDGHFRFPVQCQPNEAKIEVVTDSALPVKLLAAEFESMMIPRSRRYGA